MKKLIATLIIAAFALVCGFAESALKSIAVATFEVSGNVFSSDEAESITELYIAELVSTGKISVVDRTNFNKILKEMQFQAGDWANSEKTVKLGTAIGAEIISRGQIIKLGSKMYLSATLIDVKTAKVLSSAKVQFVSIDDIFGILTKFAKEAVEGLSLKIGDIGLGGGLVFYIEGNRAYECSEVLGERNWNEAKTLCSKYRGGGYDDWYLPNKDELNYIYQNLRKSGKILGNSKFWSSSINYNGDAWEQRFSDGNCDDYPKTNTLSVRAVRAFYIDDGEPVVNRFAHTLSEKNKISSEKTDNRSNETAVSNETLLEVVNDKSNETVVVNETPKQYRIGDEGEGGGIIFYVSQEGFLVYDGMGESKLCHYLEMSKSTLGISNWAPTLDTVNTFDGIGYGKSNTYKIVKSQKKSSLTKDNCAAYRCSLFSTEKTTAGDWFLPSKDELNLMYKTMNATVVSDASSSYFWSSSESTDNNIWIQHFSDGMQYDDNGKDYHNSVRAVRAF